MKILKYLIVFLLVIGIIGALAGVKFLQISALIEAGESFTGPPPESVAVGEVVQDQWEQRLTSIGTVTGVDGVIVRTEVPGVITSIPFSAGDSVRKGDVLVQLDASIERANLKQAQADAELAASRLKRVSALTADGTLPAADQDEVEARMAEVEARIEALKAALNKKTIRAPFSGTAGIMRIRKGEYVNPGDPLVSLQSLDPVYVEFSIPQGELGKLREGLTVRASNEAYAGESFQGRITAIDPYLNEETRNVDVQATFRNPAQKLRGGMYVDVAVILPGKRNVNLIPTTAILYAPYGNTVFVVNEPEKEGDPLTVSQQIVRTGDARGDFVEILEGLEGNERVVTAGAFKLRNGMQIVISDEGVRDPSQDPKVEDS